MVLHVGYLGREAHLILYYVLQCLVVGHEPLLLSKLEIQICSGNGCVVQTDRQADRQTDRQTVRQTDRWRRGQCYLVSKMELESVL